MKVDSSQLENQTASKDFTNMIFLQGRVRFPTGGKVREPSGRYGVIP